MPTLNTNPDRAVAAQSDVTATLRRLRLVPVVVIDDPLRAPELGTALAQGGLPCAEITLRTPRALEALERMVDSNPELYVGAGTVLTEGQAAAARKAGARFVVAPGFSPHVVEYCLTHDIPVYPGVCTPTEIEAALRAGLRELKFFPVEPLGGVTYLKAVSAPYRDIRFIPTGGITLASVGGYLSLSSVIACGGSWIAPPELIDAGRFDTITETARAAVAVVRG